MLPILAEFDWTGVIIVPVVVSFFLYRFFTKRLEHKKIMAAIEKGLPLPTKPTTTETPRWITGISVGVGFIIVSLTFLGLFLVTYIHKKDFEEGMLVPPGICLAVGVTFIVSGLLQRKFQK